MLALDRDDIERAAPLAEELTELAARVRPGAEVAIAGALRALTRTRAGNATEGELPTAIAALREAAAKYELSFVLTRWAAHALMGGRLDDAVDRATDALEIAEAIGRISEIAIARSMLALAAQRHEDTTAAVRHLDAVAHAAEPDLSATARRLLATVRGA